MIGIIGYGFVGKAVEYGFRKVKCIISDPKYNDITIKNVCDKKPKVIFVCVPTPTDDTNYSCLISVLEEIKKHNYKGIICVKSTILPDYIEDYDIVYNPEFLSRQTFKKDFVRPKMLVIGGKKSKKLLTIYKKYSCVKTKKVFLTDIRTASLLKYTMNCFYSLKITYMNAIFDIANKLEIDYNNLINILAQHPWMGTNHFQVPGPDGQRGFGGPCFPKDLEAFAKKYNVKLLNEVLNLNLKYRKN
jgi:nucleotide sugar dehydrogenase